MFMGHMKRDNSIGIGCSIFIALRLIILSWGGDLNFTLNRGKVWGKVQGLINLRSFSLIDLNLVDK